MTPEEFRMALPQFSAELYPDTRVQFWLALAAKALPAERWGDLLPEGTVLYAAHHLTLERAASLDAQGTGGMDVAAGPVTAVTKTVGSVSKSESRAGTAAAGIIGSGQWAQTIWGQQFYQLVLLVGAGGAQV